MDLSTGVVQGVLITLAVLVLAGALIVVSIRNLFRAALSLGVVLLGVAGLFIVLAAEFLAFVQILVYVGAILTLVVFAVMLTARTQADATTIPASRQRLSAALVSLALFGVLTLATQSLAAAPVPDHVVSLAQLGQELVTSLVLPFEVISLVFVAALVGAIALAASESSAPFSSPKKSS